MLNDQLCGCGPERIACAGFVEARVSVRNQFRIGRTRDIGIAGKVNGMSRPPSRRVLVGARSQQDVVAFAASPLGESGNVTVHDAFNVEKDGAATRETSEKCSRQRIDCALSLGAAGGTGDKEVLANLTLRPVHASDPNAAPALA